MAECEMRLSQHCSGTFRHLATYMKRSRYTMQTTPELYTESFKTLSPEPLCVPLIQQQPCFGTLGCNPMTDSGDK